jgi:cbb3-type cytochrome oxidase subunit 1
MAQRFLQIAVVYLCLGALLGITMGIAGNFALAPVHAHLLLLGWVTLALAGVIYHLYPAAAATRLAKLHFWLHNLGLPVFMASLGLLLTGRESMIKVAIVSSIAVLVGLGLFAFNVLTNVKAASRP